MKLTWIQIVVLAAVPALLAGLALGWLLGRAALERQWSEPQVTLSPSAAEHAAQAKDADPTPRAGARVLKPMPLYRARAAMSSLTRNDPLRVTVGAAGRDDTTSSDLHLILENKGDCEITSYAGIAYGYGADGKPSPMNAGGEQFVAFSGVAGQAKEGEDFPKIPAGDHAQHSSKLRHAGLVNLVLAQIDELACSNGKTWKRN